MIAIEKNSVHNSVRDAVARQIISLAQALGKFVPKNTPVEKDMQEQQVRRPTEVCKLSLADDAAKEDLLCGRSNYAKGIIMSH